MVRGMQDMPDPVRFQWQTTVEPLQTAAGEGAGWMLHSPEHGAAPQRYRTVLLAVPAPQAVALLEAVAPEAARLARSARMREALHFLAAADLSPNTREVVDQCLPPEPLPA
jgi:predicted NAD/FAD-dependent oxidoreductase